MADRHVVAAVGEIPPGGRKRVSVKGRDIEVSKGMAVGADAYVTKPFSTKDLIAKVRQMLGD